MPASLPGFSPGFRFIPGFLDRRAQEALVAALREVLAQAPLYIPRMPGSGRPMSVRMSNCGPLGWVTDERGYRYQETHPETFQPWPAMPDVVVRAWSALAQFPQPAQCCLINYYAGAAKLGLHQDRDEGELAAPVVSLSLGDTCLFRLGGTARGGATSTLRLASGDAVVLGGAARLAFHGVDRIVPGSSTLLPEGGRFNLTLRRVTAG